MRYELISADSHVNEPPGTWVDRVPAKLRNQAPRIVPTPDGGEGWQFPDEKNVSSFGLASATLAKGVVRSPEQYIPSGLKFEEIAKGSWDPKQHIEDMKNDGCDASVLYIGVAASVYNIKDRELRLACFRAYNDWLGEFCSYDPSRLIGPPLLPVEEETIRDALDELQRNVKQWNIKTAQIPIFPWKRYFGKFYDPLWTAAQEMDLPVAFHRGLNRSFSFGNPSQGGPFMANQVMRDFSYCMPVADLVFGGVFDRFPDLKVVSAEGRTGWLVHFVQRADESIRRHGPWAKIKLNRPPSECIKRNLYSTFIEDRVGIMMREMIGVDTQMWSSDYPHSDSTWPNSLKCLDEQFEGVPPEERYQMVAGNAIRLYKLN
jgi:predicted TIM-barrel fold metal-dependent hydrolase